MYAHWPTAARAAIAKAVKDLPDDADLKARRAALRAVGWKFHGDTSWGKKVWSKECRAYLERHGLPPLPPKALRPGTRAYSAAQETLFDQKKLEAADITFPFRGQP